MFKPFAAMLYLAVGQRNRKSVYFKTQEGKGNTQVQVDDYYPFSI
jgi:hypothetical protein